MFPGERLLSGAGLPALVYVRPGRRDMPIVLFFPGGGHLARIAYGHPGCRPSDFIDHWLAQRGYGFVAISHPTDHRLFDTVYPEMSIAQFARAAAEILQSLAHELGGNGLIVMGWSMAGRIAIRFNQEALRLGLSVEAFMALSATPPIPGLAPISTALTPLTAKGLRQFIRADRMTVQLASWLAALEEQNFLNGRVIVSEDTYRSEYVANNAVNLHGEVLQFHRGRIEELPARAVSDVGMLHYDDAPLTGLITSNSPADAPHAIAGAARWGFLNAQKLLSWSGAVDMKALPQSQWHEILELAAELPVRLTRTVPGNHFFFLGEKGAEETVVYIDDLRHAIGTVKCTLASLIGRPVDKLI